MKLIDIFPDCLVPKDVPKGLILTLIAAVWLCGFSGLRHGHGDRLEGWLHVFENWVLHLVLLPALTALVSMPIKYRDHSFDVKTAYYMGMFVGLIFMLSKLRYWR